MPLPITEYVPQVARAAAGRRAWAAWAAAAGAAGLVVGVLWLAPAARAGGWALGSELLYRVFHVACHQQPERSFHFAGFPLAVCARCTGLYVGVLVGLLGYPLARGLGRADAPWRGWLLMAAVPTSVDFLLGVTGLWENTHLSRFLTALLAGAAAAFYVVPGAVGLAGRAAGRVVGRLESREAGRGEVSRLT